MNAHFVNTLLLAVFGTIMDFGQFMNTFNVGCSILAYYVMRREVHFFNATSLFSISWKQLLDQSTNIHSLNCTVLHYYYYFNNSM